MNFQCMSSHIHAFLLKNLPGNGSSEGKRRRDTAREMTAASIIIISMIFYISGIIRMSRAHLALQFSIIPGMLVFIPNFHGQRCTCGIPIKVSGQYSKTVLFLSRCRQWGTPRGAACHFLLYPLPVNRDSRRQSIDNRTDARAMRLPKQSHPYGFSPGITHNCIVLLSLQNHPRNVDRIFSHCQLRR